MIVTDCKGEYFMADSLCLGEDNLMNELYLKFVEFYGW